jgi:protein-S-isoprenylcysteine O-methyltransferase Ste14
MDDLKFQLFLGLQGLAAVLLFAFVWFWPGTWNTPRVIGSVLLVSGMLLVFNARLQLGRSFSVTAQARKLVTHGLYSRIRNPIYVFGTVAIAGLCLVLQKPGLWLLLVLVVAMQTVRARNEARVLEAKFGDEYRAYRNRTWF